MNLENKKDNTSFRGLTWLLPVIKLEKLFSCYSPKIVFPYKADTALDAILCGTVPLIHDNN